MIEFSSLSDKLQRSAESVGIRGGRLVPLHYGSAAGELALCVRGVGMVDRDDLSVLTITTHPNALDRLTAETGGAGLAVGEAAQVGHTYWARLAADHALVVLPAPTIPAFCEQILRLPDALEASVEEAALQAIGVVGPATVGLLTDLGAYGALVGANGRGRVATSSIVDAFAWLLLDDSNALVLVEPEHAVATWTAIGNAGRRFGLGYVGAEAAQLFENIRRPTGDRAGH
jgi:glycine cleavage system aminomethyltransferase T